MVTREFIGSAEISEYAYDLFNEWGIGDSEKNNGVLLLVVTGAEDYYMLQGSGLEDCLTSGTLKTILNEYMEPYFAAGDYDAGVLATMNEIFTRLASYYNVTLTASLAQTGGADDTYVTNSVYETEPAPAQKLSIFGIIGKIGSFLVKGVFFVILIILVIVIILLSSIGRGGRRYRGWHNPPPPPPGGGFGGPRPGGFGGGPRMNRPGGPMGGGRPGGGFGGPRPGGGHMGGGGRPGGGFGGGRTGGGGGGHMGGGGHSRGGGAGRH